MLGSWNSRRLGRGRGNSLLSPREPGDTSGSRRTPRNGIAQWSRPSPCPIAEDATRAARNLRDHHRGRWDNQSVSTVRVATRQESLDEALLLPRPRLFLAPVTTGSIVSRRRLSGEVLPVAGPACVAPAASSRTVPSSICPAWPCHEKDASEWYPRERRESSRLPRNASLRGQPAELLAAGSWAT